MTHPQAITYATAILHNPAGTFSLVGSVPVSLCHRGRMGLLRANVYPTEDEAIKALLAAGIERFQLADCSWYSPERKGD